MDLTTYLHTWYSLTNQICPVDHLLAINGDQQGIQDALWDRVVLKANYGIVFDSVEFQTYQNFVRFRNGQQHV